MILAIVQARMGSTRLPGKVLTEIDGRPLIDHVVERVHAATLLNYVCVATTDQPEDDALAAHAATLHNVTVYRGHATDVLARFYGASLLFPEADVIVRITADDPVKDPTLIDRAVEAYLHGWAEPDTTLGSPAMVHLGGLTWPMGLDVEVFSRDALHMAHARATSAEDREHVTPWILRTLGCWQLKDDQHRGTINCRYTIDTPADLEFARMIYQQMRGTGHAGLFGYDDMIRAGVPTGAPRHPSPDREMY